MSEAVFSEEQYKELKKAIVNNKFKKVFTLMKTIPDLEMQCLNLQARHTRFKAKKNAGTTDEKFLDEELNRITQSITGVIEPYKPQIEESPETLPSSNNSTYSRKINTHNDRKLQRSQKILGREEKFNEIYPLLGEKAPALLLKGEGGIGKTDFCKILLEKYLTDHPSAQVWWIDVEYMDSIESLVGTLALSLGLEETTPRATVLAKLAEQPALYYLDNLESITDAKAATDFFAQLIKINNIYWLASSRSKISEWKTVNLQELDAKAALQVFANQWANSSGQELEEYSEELTDFIEHDLGFHPLSIILAASRGADYSGVSEVIEKWKEGEATVREKEASDANHRLTSLDLSLELSYNALKDPYAKQLWAICAFFPQGMGKEDLKYFVEKRGFPLSARAELIKRSILRNKEGKLTLLPPFADYMKRKLEGDEEAVFVENSLGFCLEYPRENLTAHPLWLNRIPYIFEFLKYVVNKFKKYPKIWELYKNMFNDWDQMTFTSKEILGKIMENDCWNENGKYKAECVFNLGKIEFSIGENNKAKVFLKQAKILYKEIGFDLGIANVLACLGEIESSIEEYDTARAFFKRAEVIYQKVDSDLGRANILINLGQIEFKLKEYDKAKKFYVQAEKIYQRTKNDQGIANILANVSQIEYEVKNYEKGIQLAKKSLLISKKCGYVLGEFIALLILGRYMGVQKNKVDAIKHFTACKKMAKKMKIEKYIKIAKEMEAEALKNCEE